MTVLWKNFEHEGRFTSQKFSIPNYAITFNDAIKAYFKRKYCLCTKACDYWLAVLGFPRST